MPVSPSESTSSPPPPPLSLSLSLSPFLFAFTYHVCTRSPHPGHWTHTPSPPSPSNFEHCSHRPPPHTIYPLYHSPHQSLGTKLSSSPFSKSLLQLRTDTECEVAREGQWRSDAKTATDQASFLHLGLVLRLQVQRSSNVDEVWRSDPELVQLLWSWKTGNDRGQRGRSTSTTRRRLDQASPGCHLSRSGPVIRSCRSTSGVHVTFDAAYVTPTWDRRHAYVGLRVGNWQCALPVEVNGKKIEEERARLSRRTERTCSSARFEAATA